MNNPSIIEVWFRSNYLYVVLVVPALLLALAAQLKIKSTYAKYRSVNNSKGITGRDAALMVLRSAGITDVSVVKTGGTLTDNYNPRNKMISLSSDIYGGTSIAAVGIACHEASHALQHARGYTPVKMRDALVPVCNIGSAACLPLALAGIFFNFQILISIGLIMYASIALFQLVTLPVEFEASGRALKIIQETEMLTQDEYHGAKQVLSAAAMTYVAALIVSLANLLRLLLLTRRRND